MEELELNQLDKLCRVRKFNMLAMFVVLVMFIVTVTLFVIGIVRSETRTIAVDGIFVGIFLLFFLILVINRVMIEKRITKEQAKLIEELKQRQNDLLNQKVYMPNYEEFASKSFIAQGDQIIRPKRKYTKKQK